MAIVKRFLKTFSDSNKSLSSNAVLSGSQPVDREVFLGSHTVVLNFMAIVKHFLKLCSDSNKLLFSNVVLSGSQLTDHEVFRARVLNFVAITKHFLNCSGSNKSFERGAQWFSNCGSK